MERQTRAWWPAALWMSVIFATSSSFISSKQWVNTVTTRGPVRMSQAHFQSFWDQWWWVFVKGYHVLEFALLTALLIRPLRGRIVPAALIAFLYACSDEYHQTFVPYRGGKWTDVAIDTIGVALVSAVVLLIRQRKSPITQGRPTPHAPHHDADGIMMP